MPRLPDCDSQHDFLDNFLDGEPAMIVFTPSLRRALRRRAAERTREEWQPTRLVRW